MALVPSSQFLQPEYHGDGRDRLPVIGSSGTTQQSGNYSPTVGTDFPVPARELFIANDDPSNSITITVVCNGGTLSWVLLAGETFNERLPTFTQVIVVAANLWRWYVRGNLQ